MEISELRCIHDHLPIVGPLPCQYALIRAEVLWRRTWKKEEQEEKQGSTTHSPHHNVIVHGRECERQSADYEGKEADTAPVLSEHCVELFGRIPNGSRIESLDPCCAKGVDSFSLQLNLSASIFD
jgi:hypothetical protein